MKKTTLTLALVLLAITSVFSQTTLVDFDGTPSTDGGWNGTSEVLANPKTDGINTSANACKYTIGSNDWWGANAAWVQFDTDINYADMVRIEVMVLASKATQIYAKLENKNADGESQPEAWGNIEASDNWQLVSLGFSGLSEEEAATAIFNQLTIFFNPNDGVAGDSWHYDNVLFYGNVATPEPKAPSNLRFTAITSDSFTLNWDNDVNATDGTNIFIEEPASASGNKYITTVAAGVTSYTYQGNIEGIDIDAAGIYIARLQALPDTDYSAYTEALINMNEPAGSDITFDPNFHIYLCFGQSNMEGAATIEAQDRIADGRLKVLQSLPCANLNRQETKWYTALPPLCQCYTGLSVADYFGKTMIENLADEISVGIVHVAVGGSDIRLFDKDIYTNYTDTYDEDWFKDKITAYGDNPYEHFINLAKEAQKSGVIKGILLHQGETNAGDVQWPTYVESVYENILSDLSLAAADVPLLAGEVGNADAGGDLSDMNDIIATLPDLIPTAHIISSSECTIQDDNIHFDSEGARKLGARYADKMLMLLDTSTSTDAIENNAAYVLGQNYPNPVLNSASISFVIPKATFVSIKLINMQGNAVAELAGKTYNTGQNSVRFNVDKLAAGMYFYTLKADNFTSTKKMFIAEY